MKYVAYYRVSTKKQSLGLDAQRTVVTHFLTANVGELVAEYSEKESGKKSEKERPQLQAALTECERTGATLLVAKLDRLSRDAEFIWKLHNNGTRFLVAERPNMGTLELGIAATIAQDERETISKRTKAALAEVRAKGGRIGRQKGEGCEESVRAAGLQARRENAQGNAANVAAWRHVRLCRKMGMSWKATAKELNEAGLKTARGGTWQHSQVQNLARLMQQA